MAQSEDFINIDFPFSDDPKGKYLFLNNISQKAIKANLLHLLLTNKGERLYLPDFGANLRQYIFEPNDGITHGKIIEEIQTAIDKYIPNLRIDTLDIEGGIEGEIRNEHHALVTIEYTVTDGAFESSETIQIEL